MMLSGGRKASNSKLLARTAVNNDEYQLVVEEIKRENKILGSLQMQQEVMKRLNERRGGDKSAVVADGSSIDYNINDNNTLPRKPRSQKNNFMQSLASSMHDSLGSLGNAFKHLEDELNVRRLAKSDNSNNNSQVIPGRRESAAIPIGYDQTIIAAQVLQDLDLSDSDDSSHDINEVFNGGGGERTSSSSRKDKRPSVLRRGSSKIKGVIGRRISIKRRTSSLSFGGNSSGGLDSTTEVEEEGVGGEDNNGKREVEQEEQQLVSPPGCTSGNNVQSTSSSSNVFEKNTTNNEDDDNDDKSTKKKDNTTDRTTTPSTNSDIGSSPKRQQQPHRRSGKRRSSLFSVDEKRASITGGITGGPPTIDAGINNSSVDGQSSSFSSLQGSFSSKEIGSGGKNEPLLCSFARMYSMDSSPGASIGSSPGACAAADDDDDGTLICDWGRRQSMLSNSGTSMLSQDDMALLNINTNHHHHGGKIKDDSSLICGWDERRHSLSITSDISIDIPKDVTIGEISSEIQLQAAKESCTLFNAR